MGRKYIPGGKELNTNGGKEMHTGWEKNKYTHPYYPLSSNLVFLFSSNLSHIFDGYVSLISISDILQWKTNNVFDMSYMFNYYCSLNLYLIYQIGILKK